MSANNMALLAVEDDDVDFYALQRTLGKLGISNPVKRAVDGVEAFEVLSGEASGLDPLKTTLILLDLNMPRIDGLDFLARLRRDPHLSHMPVMVMTTSSRPEDVKRAHGHGACVFIQKSDLHNGLRDAFTDLGMLKTFVVAP